MDGASVDPRFFVVKRDGRHVPVEFDKITHRIQLLCGDLAAVEAVEIAQTVTRGVFSGVSTSALDDLAAETAVARASQHPQFSVLAARIAITNMHKNTVSSFSENARMMREYHNPETGMPAPQLSAETYRTIQENAEFLDNAVDYSRDLTYDFFGFKTLERSYLLKRHGKVAERPQQMLMRVAVGIHGDNMEAVVETYNMMSRKLFTHASPTLFNAGTPNPQLSSCYLLTMKDDSIEGIFDTLKQCARISKFAGGIGLSVHGIRGTGSYIAGTNGTSNGLVPMLRMYNDAARYVDQGGGKRKGSFAMYLEPWHPDIYEFIELKKNHGHEHHRARDLFYAMWIPDLFMRRVDANGQWSIMCPNQCPGLMDVYGPEFDALYTRYEGEGKVRRTVQARDLWNKILVSQIETGTPYMLYKDAANTKSNQKNLGTIRSSNLCTEVIQYSSADEVAVCNLASVNLASFVDATMGTYNFDELVAVVRVMTRNLNKVIDVNMYPVPEAHVSNMKHRPIGIGIQALADVFLMLRMPFDSMEARQLNKDIFEAIYYAAVTESVELAKRDGAYESFPGSPASQGILQFDMWGQDASTFSGRFDWDDVKLKVVEHGLRNSLLLAPMPTASTSQILGNNECFEPYTSNLFTRRTLSGEFTMVNEHLMRDLMERDLWNEDVRNALISAKGSVQGITGIPSDLKLLYRTVWEIPMRSIIDMSADRGVFVCQSQSLNLYQAEPTTKKLSSMHFYAWRKGLKTGMYYLHTRPKADAIAFTVNRESAKRALSAQHETTVQEEEEEEEECLSCGA